MGCRAAEVARTRGHGLGGRQEEDPQCGVGTARHLGQGSEQDQGPAASPDTQTSTKTMLAKLGEQTELRESSGRVQVQGDGGKNYP